MKLSSRQTRYLRSLAHKLNPAVQLGKAGLTPALLKEIDRNLGDHELIKMRISADDRAELLAHVAAIVAGSKAELVQVIGHIAVFYRPAKEPKIQFPGPSKAAAAGPKSKAAAAGPKSKAAAAGPKKAKTRPAKPRPAAKGRSSAARSSKAKSRPAPPRVARARSR
jgi:RNA-binding protein